VDASGWSGSRDVIRLVAINPLRLKSEWK
jgi:hypothetical protein